ncbi:MAG TPA: ADP-ribosylglycohydrolase family protein [Pirellulaceae bacterium]|nr:ADP-ribosylglycohydrolase family protein [Pirellulaceae bacterium]
MSDESVLDDPLARATESLAGLSVGDAIGQCTFDAALGQQVDVSDPDSLPPGPWRWTDDTEMALSVVESLSCRGRIDQSFLARRFAERYSYDRAYGPAMHRALGRIREGESWSSVAPSLFDGQGSYGNGAAMRSAPVGAFFAGNDEAVVREAGLSAETTHAHPEGVAGAVAVACAAAFAIESRASGAKPSHALFLDRVIEFTPASEVRRRLAIAQAMETVRSIQFPARTLGGGREMAAFGTVPFALWCAAQSLDDFQQAIRLGITGGIDRDTVCAIVGGVVACYVGSRGIPAEWLQRREPLPPLSTFES